MTKTDNYNSLITECCICCLYFLTSCGIIFPHFWTKQGQGYAPGISHIAGNLLAASRGEVYAQYGII